MKKSWTYTIVILILGFELGIIAPFIYDRLRLGQQPRDIQIECHTTTSEQDFETMHKIMLVRGFEVLPKYRSFEGLSCYYREQEPLIQNKTARRVVNGTLLAVTIFGPLLYFGLGLREDDTDL